MFEVNLDSNTTLTLHEHQTFIKKCHNFQDNFKIQLHAKLRKNTIF